MAEELKCSLSEETPELEPEDEAPDMASPWEEDWRETTLRRLEGWIEEREMLIAEFERRIREEEALLAPACPAPAWAEAAGETARNGAATA